MKIKQLAFLIFSTLLFSCGGGGGGSSASPVVNVPPPPTYTYNTVYDTYLNGGAYDVRVTGLSYRRYSETGGLWKSWHTPNTFSITARSNGTTIVSISRDYDFTPDGGSSALDFSYDFSLDTANYGAPNDVSGILNGYMYQWEIKDEQKNLDTLTSFQYYALWLDYYVDTGPQYLNTNYVHPFLAVIGYGDNCTFCTDNDPREDFWAGVYGDFTAAGDMPTSGQLNYKVKAQAWWAYGSSQSDGSKGHVVALEGDGTFMADLSQMTVSGDILLDYVQYYTGLKREGYTAGSVNLTGSISGNSFSGDATWAIDTGTGTFSGNFFGPDAREVGGVFNIASDEGFKHLLGSFVGCETSGC